MRAWVLLPELVSRPVIVFRTIYPSLSRRAYERLIEQGCARYVCETEGRCGLRFDLDASHVASFEGGYNAYTSRKVWSRRNLLDSICTSLAGRIRMPRD